MLNCVFLLRRSASFLSSFFSEAVILGAFIADQQLDFCITFIQSCNRKQETETYCSKNILFQQKPCSFQHFRNSEKNLCTLHNLHVRAASIGPKAIKSKFKTSCESSHLASAGSEKQKRMLSLQFCLCHVSRLNEFGAKTLL